MGFTPINGLANRRLRPLGHPSAARLDPGDHNHDGCEAVLAVTSGGVKQPRNFASNFRLLASRAMVCDGAGMSSPAPSSIDMLQRLVAFDTTSRNSNLELIQYIKGYLGDHGV